MPGWMFSQCARAAGESAEAFALLMRGMPGWMQDRTLEQTAALFDELSAGGRASRRDDLLAGYLEGADPLVGKLLLKTLCSGLRIGLSELLLEHAVAAAFGMQVQAVRRARHLCGDMVRTALAAAEGRLEQIGASLFTPLSFMLAGTQPIDGPVAEAGASAENEAGGGTGVGGDWLVEDKYDGIRVQVHIGGREQEAPAEDGARDGRGGSGWLFAEEGLGLGAGTGVQVRIFSRGMEEITQSFPELAEAMAGFGHGRSCMVDGEVLAVGSEGRAAPFSVLQQRLNRRQVSEAVKSACPVRLVAYDLLYLDGELLIDRPLRERRQLLGGLNLGPAVVLSPATELGGRRLADLYAEARARGNEGLMLKRPEGTYEPGRRSSTWLKVKQPLGSLDVVVTAAEPGHGKRQGLLSDLTFAVRTGDGADTAWVNVGKAYTGLTDAEIQRMTRLLNRITVRRAGHVRLVEPVVVLEVAFDGVQASRRHRSGFALRFPRIVRWREDKPAEQADTLEAVRALWVRTQG